MRFRPDAPIFLQIAESLEDQILRGELQADGRIPAVRDLALSLEVNPNTVVRSVTELEQAGVIYKRRGIGYFVAEKAREKILARRRRKFLESDLPAVFKTMRLLGVDMQDIVSLYERES